MILVSLLIFVLRVLDITAATLRMLMVIRGRKDAAWLLGFIQALFFVSAIGAVLSGLDNWLNIIGYATGYGTGTVAGMWLEEKLALGHVNLRIISPLKGPELAEFLRSQSFGVTELWGRGRDGAVSLLNCSIMRKDIQRVTKLIRERDEKAFVTADEVKPLWRGFWGK